MTEQPLVSICITSHNYARYLPAALDAALGQTYPHVEVVVVDQEHDGIGAGMPFREAEGSLKAHELGFYVGSGLSF